MCVLGAGGASLVMAWLGLYGFGWNDYEVEVLPALNALTRGDVLTFLRIAPSYGGSLIERAPFALLPGLWGGGQLAVYRMVALPCLLSAVVLAVWLCSRLRAARMPVLWRALAVGVCVANPITLQALEEGHPEELLGACLCIGAVLVAMRGRVVWAGVLLGLAIANKEWALLAAGPVLLALPPVESSLSRAPALSPTPTTPKELRDRHRRYPLRRWRAWPAIVCLAVTAAVAGLILAPLMLVPGGGFTATTGSVASSHSEIFQPWQVFWFLGWHGSMVHGLFGVPKPGFRDGPGWVGLVSHPLVLIVGFALAGGAWLQRFMRARPGMPSAAAATTTTALSSSSTTVAADSAHAATNHAADPARRGRDALLLLALVFLLRCLLDSWDIGYYLLPCSIALCVWETIGERRPPVLTLAGLIAPWVLLEQLAGHGLSPDAQSALFLAWTLPLTAYLALRLYAPGVTVTGRLAAVPRARRHAIAPSAISVAGAPQEITVSSLGNPVSTS